MLTDNLGEKANSLIFEDVNHPQLSFASAGCVGIWHLGKNQAINSDCTTFCLKVVIMLEAEKKVLF